MDRKLNQDQKVKLIELYRSHELLWNTNILTYRRNDLKAKALDAIAKEMSLPVDMIKKKIRALRITYIAERKKMIEGIMYVPSVFWFNEMRFLDSYISFRKSSDSANQFKTLKDGCKADKDIHCRIGENEAVEHTKSLQYADIERDQCHRDQENLEETESRFKVNAQTHRDNETCVTPKDGKISQFEDAIARKRYKAAERNAKWLAKKIQKRLQKIRDANRAAYLRRREQETLEERDARLKENSDRHQRRRDQETLEESDARRKADAQYHILIRKNETLEPAQSRHNADSDDESNQHRQDQETFEETDTYRKAVANIKQGIRDNDTEILSILRSI